MTYSAANAQQKAITSSIIEDLIINCSLPLSIIENRHFKHFLTVVDSKYTPPARNTIKTRLFRMADEIQTDIKEKLISPKSVNTTLDIWSDRRMRSYLGITCHYISMDNFTLCTVLLACTRFTGTHSGDRIAAEVESILTFYNIKDKVDYYLTDNAANMKKAFTIAFNNSDDSCKEVELDGEDVEHPELWESIDDDVEKEIIETLTTYANKSERLSCFDHTLHLVVGDGLKDTKCISISLAKCSKISSILHTSSLFKDCFENAFGSNTGISSIVSTRWNSTLRQLKCITSLDDKKLSNVLEQQGHKNLILSSREYSQLNELIDILDPFLEATSLTEGDKVATISFVLPSVLGLINHLTDLKLRIKFCGSICSALLASMMKR